MNRLWVVELPTEQVLIFGPYTGEEALRQAEHGAAGRPFTLYEQTAPSIFYRECEDESEPLKARLSV